MKKLIILSCLLIFCELISHACTSAVISGEITKNGHPLLWKHRDTGEENNKVERIPAKDGAYEYVALYNASDTECREAWIGFNSRGFAIMNTASYNIKDDSVKDMDKEGFLMSKALSVCVTVNDFEVLLKKLPKPLGVEANFGVIDAEGNGAYFETNNNTYKKYDLKDSPDGILIRTNYSHSGRKDEGYGYIRENNAEILLAPYVKAKNIEPATFTEYLSRSFYHSLIGKDYASENVTWVVDQDFIPRNSSSATVVIEGVKPGEEPGFTTMWTGIGYPPCSEICPVWLGENGVPTELRGDSLTGRSILCDEVVKRKYEVFPIKKGSGKKYLNIKKLYNDDGTGYCQRLRVTNLDNYRKGYEILETRRNK